MSKPLPKRLELKCPLCRGDIGGILVYDEVREWLKRQERRMSRIQIRLQSADRKRAAVSLRRLVMEESGMELNIVDRGKKLGLRSLSESLVDFIWDEIFSADLETDRSVNYATMKQEDFKLELSRMVEKRIIEYFTTPPASARPPDVG